MHASYSFPSALVPLVDLALLAVAVLVLVLWPRATRRWAGRAWHVLALARTPRRALAAIFLLGAVANGLVYAVLGPPIPRVTDEHAYLLAADTFASGRLANPSHPMWRHFDVHSIQWPVYAPKYPPAQGLFLAAGQVVAGTPAAAVCVGAGLLGAACCWALQGWLRPRWALFGGLLVLVRLGVGGYWSQSYWGGTVPAIGGALVFGALPRLLGQGRRRHGAILALGLVILANSRPYEGLLASLPVFAVLAWRLRRDRRLLRALLPAAAILVAAVLAMLGYNARITGEASLFPHQAYTIAYNAEPEFVFSRPWGPPFSYQERAPERAAAPELEGPRPPWVARALRLAARRLAGDLYVVLGLSLAPVLLLIPLGGRWRPLAAACVLVVVGHGLARPWFPHYAAPIVLPLTVLALAGLRRLASSGERWRAAPFAVLVVQVLLTVFQLPGQRPDPGDWSVQRKQIAERLEATPEKDLVIVHRPNDWITNAADVDASPVVWARDLGPEANAELVDYFGDRRVWWLDLTELEPELVRWPEPRPTTRP